MDPQIRINSAYIKNTQQKNKILYVFMQGNPSKFLVCDEATSSAHRHMGYFFLQLDQPLNWGE